MPVPWFSRVVHAQKGDEGKGGTLPEAHATRSVRTCGLRSRGAGDAEAGERKILGPDLPEISTVCTSRCLRWSLNIFKERPPSTPPAPPAALGLEVEVTSG